MTHDDFLQAILEAPDEDGPRLVYADWLEDSGRLERAEFIRVQCALARLPDADPRRQELETREQALLAEHEREWAESPSPNIQLTFERGIVTGARMPAKQFSKLADLFGWFPTVRHLRIVGPFRDGKPSMQTIARPPYLARLASLDIRRGYYSIGPEAVATLAGAPNARGLTSLSVHESPIGPHGVAAIASSPNLGRLTTLSLSCYGFNTADYVGREGARALAWSPSLPRLTTLRLAKCRLGDEGCRVMAGAPYLTGLTTLDLSSNGVGDEGARALLAAPNLRGLSKLDVRDNPLSESVQEELLVRFGDRVSLPRRGPRR